MSEAIRELENELNGPHGAPRAILASLTLAGGPVPFEYSIARLTWAITDRPSAAMVG